MSILLLRRLGEIRCTAANFGVRMMSVGSDFDSAVKRLSTLKEQPSNEVKLKIYGLFKQSTTGVCKGPKPGAFDLVGKAKWNAWSSLGQMSQDEAKKEYVRLVNQLAGESDAKETPSDSTPTTGPIETSQTGKVFNIRLNRPEKRNALTTAMYEQLIVALDQAAKSSATVTVFSGTGDYFCSGNDLGNFANIDLSQIGKMAKDANDLLRRYVGAFIDHPKPLIALVHGPAIGIAVTVLGVFDVVYASDKATFHTPFSSLGQSPEGVSSYTFPRLMGLSKASEVLLFGRKLTALEARERNLVSEVFPIGTFAQECQRRVTDFSQLPPQSLQLSKGIIRGSLKQILHDVNQRECDLLEERWQSEECMTAIMNFFTKKSNL